jgi:dimethylhistidine N-methyltransferase
VTWAPAVDNLFAREVCAGLARNDQKTLPCRYFYDSVGSALFDVITLLPEYGLTRAEERILRVHAPAVIGRLPGDLIVAELGSGSGRKTRAILEAVRRRQPAVYYPIDVSADALDRCAQDLSPFGAVFPLEMSYLDGLREAASQRSSGQALLVLFLGSTIGNFEPEAGIDFLYGIRQSICSGDSLLLGTDLVKPVDQLIAAYDDAAGVTAAFNLNLLARINRELDADFDLRQFEHFVRYDEEAQRVEMHLRSHAYQTVTVQKANLTVDFVPGETICTESCHKFRPEQIDDIARAAGFRVDARWIDCEWPFADNLLRAV